MATLAEQAQRLRSLHFGDDMLVLPNAWDAGTARTVAEAGFPAVATSSAAVARARGFEDHEAMPVPVAFGAVAEIAAVLDVPVTADMESGYGLDPAEFVERLLGAGAVGCNYEDSDHARPGELRDAGEQAGRIAGLRAAAEVAGVGIVINARIDTFVRQLGTVDEQLAEGVRRARLYFDAGADCVYPITLADDAVIDAFLQEVGGPVNILMTPRAPSLLRLGQLGVRRVSFGSGLYCSAMDAFAGRVEEIRASTSSS
jgi:2-methylisocitrate lyase-like PEP mutase family enzyme